MNTGNLLWFGTRIITIISMILSLTSCDALGLKTDYVSTGESGTSKQSNCSLDIYMPGQNVVRNTKEIGKIFVGDTGLTVTFVCGLDQVIKQAQEKACSAGADALQIYEIQDPAHTSFTCYQIKANLLQYLWSR